MKSEQHPEIWNQVSKSYVSYVEPFLGDFSDQVLSRLHLDGARVLDVACGPGTFALRAAPVAKTVDAVDFSGEMLAELEARIGKSSNIKTQYADGQDLPFPDNRFDIGVSMFGLMFFPDRIAGMRELARVVKPGGDIVIGAWAGFSESELFRTLFTLSPCFPEFQNAAPKPPGLDDLDVFREEMHQSGLHLEKIESMDGYFETPNVETFWSAVKCSFAGMAIFLDDIEPADLAERDVKVLEILRAEFGEGPVRLSSTANIAFAKIPT